MIKYLNPILQKTKKEESKLVVNMNFFKFEAQSWPNSGPQGGAFSSSIVLLGSTAVDVPLDPEKVGDRITLLHSNNRCKGLLHLLPIGNNGLDPLLFFTVCA